MRIVSIDNLSARAYRLRAPRFYHSLRFETPARVHAMMAAGQCDAALLPVTSFQELSDVVENAGNFGIACTGAVRSVQLFSSVPLAALLHGGQAIYATPKSRTSVQLFSLLCERHFGVRPRMTPSYTAAAGRLLIGDAAFECAQRHAAEPNNVDLGAWWLEHTGLPFVYARWVVSRSVSATDKANLIAWLHDCAEAAATPWGHAELAQREGFAPDDYVTLREYYQRIRPFLLPDDLAAEQLFHTLSEEHSHVHTAPVA